MPVHNGKDLKAQMMHNRESTKRPKILRVETGYITPAADAQEPDADIIDYRYYQNKSKLWRSIEAYLRLDILLALKARTLADSYDIVWAGSEKVGIPLSFLRLNKPLVVIAHHPESPLKAKFLRFFKIARKWAGIGYISNEGKQFFADYLNISESRLFQYESSKFLKKTGPVTNITNGSIICAGVAKRDYGTLIKALNELEGYDTHLFVSSKFGDTLHATLPTAVPPWVHFPGYVSEETLIEYYRQSRFIVVPLEETTHTGAGINPVMEAGAFGKAVIATRTGGMATFVKDGETGILVPPNDADALRKAIETLWTQPELALKMGLANRRYMEAQFNPDLVDANINKYLNSIYTKSQPIVSALPAK